VDTWTIYPRILGDFRPAHATALVNLPLPDLIVAVRYPAALVARRASTAVRTMVAQAVDALDPGRRR
jgi:hypothetical protein